MGSADQLLDFTGCIRLYNNEKNTYIVYEQMVEKDVFIPVSEGLFKFRFCTNDLPTKKEFVTHSEFTKELQAHREAGFRIYDDGDDDDAPGVTSSYVKNLIQDNNMYKYQFRF